MQTLIKFYKWAVRRGGCVCVFFGGGGLAIQFLRIISPAIILEKLGNFLRAAESYFEQMREKFWSCFIFAS